MQKSDACLFLLCSILLIVMVNSLKSFVKKRWILIIIFLSVIALIINALLFYPGYMSNDTLAMFYASRGNIPSNIAPVMLGLAWRVLYNLTGKTSSILIFQLLMLWSALCLVAVYVYKKTSSRLLSLLPLLIGVLPFVLNISGVIWRDCHMTFALALAFAIFLFAKDITNKKWRITLFILIFILSLYSALSRYNAIIALIPMVFIFARYSGYFNKLKWQIVATVMFVLITFASFPLVNMTLSTKSIDNSPGLLLDDIIRVSNENDIKNIAMPSDLRNLLQSIRKCSFDENVLVSNIFVCIKAGDDAGILYKNSGEFKRIWTQIIINNPINYVVYKVQMFMGFIIPQTDYAYIWQPGIEPNDYGEQVRFNRLGNLNYSYVHKFGYRYLRATFEPWFWLGGGLLVVFLSIKKKTKHVVFIRTLAASGVLYILGYIPTGATTDYRYIYWSVFAVILAFVLYGLDRYNERPNRAKITSKKKSAKR